MSIAALMVDLDGLPSYTQEDDIIDMGASARLNDALTMEQLEHDCGVLDHAIACLSDIHTTLESDGDLSAEATKYLGLALDAAMGKPQTLFVGGMSFKTHDSSLSLEADVDEKKKGIFKRIWEYIVKKWQAFSAWIVGVITSMGSFLSNKKKYDKILDDMVKKIPTMPIDAPTKQAIYVYIKPTPPPTPVEAPKEAAVATAVKDAPPEPPVTKAPPPAKPKAPKEPRVYKAPSKSDPVDVWAFSRQFTRDAKSFKDIINAFSNVPKTWDEMAPAFINAVSAGNAVELDYSMTESTNLRLFKALKELQRAGELHDKRLYPRDMKFVWTPIEDHPIYEAAIKSSVPKSAMDGIKLITDFKRNLSTRSLMMPPPTDQEYMQFGKIALMLSKSIDVNTPKLKSVMDDATKFKPDRRKMEKADGAYSLALAVSLLKLPSLALKLNNAMGHQYTVAVEALDDACDYID